MVAGQVERGPDHGKNLTPFMGVKPGARACVCVCVCEHCQSVGEEKVSRGQPDTTQVAA